MNSHTTSEQFHSGDVWDNSAMESFFSSLKKEYVSTREQARADVFDCVERFYNPYRRHSTLGHVNPMEYENSAERA